MKKISIYTDGACSGNPGAGGWAAILIYGEKEKAISGNEEHTTNNRMELKSIIEGLKALKEPCDVTVYSDSSYSVNPFLEGWIEKWKLNGFRGADNKEIKNPDLWESLLFEMARHKVEFIKVKGHSDNVYNNRCDRIAKEEIKKLNKPIN